MFWSEDRIDESIADLQKIDAEISDLRKRASVIVNDLNKRAVAQRRGARSITEWLSATLDLSRSNASDLVFAARFGMHRGIEHRLIERDISFDRALAALRLAEAGATAETVEASYQVDLNRVAHLTSRQRRVTRSDEQRSFAQRFFSIQPTLDESSWRLSGQLPGIEGRVVEKALHDRAEEFRSLPHGDVSTRGQRQADALIAMAQDSMDRTGDQQVDSSGTAVTVFVDLDRPTAPAQSWGPRSNTDHASVPTPSTSCFVTDRCRSSVSKTVDRC